MVFGAKVAKDAHKEAEMSLEKGAKEMTEFKGFSAKRFCLLVMVSKERAKKWQVINFFFADIFRATFCKFLNAPMLYRVQVDNSFSITSVFITAQSLYDPSEKKFFLCTRTPLRS